MDSITRKEAREGAKIFGLGWLTVLASVIAVMVITGIVWSVSVGIAGTRGDGNVHKDQQDSHNREHWSAVFNGAYNQIKADQANITTLKAAAESKSADKQDEINYTGAKLACQTDVATYNGYTGDLLGKLWIPAELPAYIDDATTYCG